MEKKKYTILVVEDNDINREILNTILEEDFNLFVAENGQEAMSTLKENASKIDLVLLDIVMPIMDGYEVLKAIKQDEALKEIPVVVTTGNDSMEEEVRCLQMGASDFVRKPYSPAVVRLRVDSIFRLRESTQSNLQKTRFIQQISHEVRTPLNAIMGFTEILKNPEGMDAEEKEQCMGIIMDNALILKRMIDDLLALSDVDNGVLQFEKKYVAFNETCRSAINTTKFYHPEGVNVYYTSNLPDSLLIFTDSKRVQQLLINLINNACKYTEKGEIHVDCSNTVKPNTLTLSVTDTGSGIPAEKADYIFERFAKLDSFKPGSGLGLSICRTIAQGLNGTIRLDTSYHNGARFVFEIPITENTTANWNRF